MKKSSKFQIDQSVTEDWPFNLIDHQGKKVTLKLKPGEMLLCECAKILHGRQKPLNGNFYDNSIIHFDLKQKPTWFTALNQKEKWKNLYQ